MLRAKKSLGQHFLSDPRVIGRIIDEVAPQHSDAIIEIGPGTGALTGRLAARAGFVTAIEADSSLIPELRRNIASDSLLIIEGDVLSVDWKALLNSTLKGWAERTGGSMANARVRVVGNLPYYISTPILQALIAHRSALFDITVMLQDEVVDRIASPPGSREYGYLSVLVQFYCEVEKLFEVGSSAFRPPPDVRSAVVRLLIRAEPAVKVQDEANYFAVVRAAFAQRRKTILNNLKAASHYLDSARSPGEALVQAGIDPRRRAETLSLDDFARLCGRLYHR